MSTSGDLFAATEAAADVDFDAMLERTLAVLDRLLAESPVCIAWSGGKDSSCLLSLTLDAARRRAQCGEPVRPIVVMTSDTLVESPEIVAYARAELRKVEAFGQRHGLDVRTVVVSPRLTESWAMTILSGRSLPSFMGSNSDCTVGLKTNPLGRAQKRLDAEMPGLVTLLGTRFSESLRRASNMRDREETAEQVWIGKDGRRYLSPLAYWTLDHVWTYVGTVMALETERTYSDFAELHRIYTDASGGGCVVVAEMAGQMKSSPCGARTGCWTCVRAERDKSLEAMIETDPRYGYMRGLNALRNMLVASRFDWSLRTWMPWAPEPDGTLVIQPYRYRPRFLALLLHLCLSLDLREKQAAAALGIAPRFEIVSLRSLIAIDAAWSLHGMQRPFEALRLWREVYERGHVIDVPVIEPVPRTPMPCAGTFQIEPWDNDCPIGGLFDPVLALSEPGGCIEHRTLKDGRLVLDLQASDHFEVDEEGAELLLQFELDRLCERGHEAPITAYMTYAQYGTVSVRPGQLGEIDQMVRRAHWKTRVGLDLDLDPEELLARVRRLALDYQRTRGLAAGAAQPRNVQLELIA